MEKKLKITFERGGVIFARLLTEEAPKTIEKLLTTLPRREKVFNARYGGSAIFIDIRYVDVERENVIQKKVPGRISMTLGNPVFVGKAIHMWYDDYIISERDENLFALTEENCLAELKAAGNRILEDGPEMALFEVVEV